MNLHPSLVTVTDPRNMQRTSPHRKGWGAALYHMGLSKNRGKPPQNGWFIMENPIKMYDLGVRLFLETSIWCYHAVFSMLTTERTARTRFPNLLRRIWTEILGTRKVFGEWEGWSVVFQVP